MTTKELHDYKERAFDAFCRTVIRNESADALRDLAEKSEHEIEMSIRPPFWLLHDRPSRRQSVVCVHTCFSPFILSAVLLCVPSAVRGEGVR